MVRRRRGPGVQWAPTVIPQVNIAQGNDSWLQFDQNLVWGSGHTISIFPLTFDYPVDPGTANVATHSMADFVGSAYILKRIVGKAFATQLPLQEGSIGGGTIMVGGGFFVARADQLTPQAPAGTLESFDPLSDNNMMEPWIWRRTWLLGNPADITGVMNPSSSGWYGSVMDGPHIDSKIKRRINDDDRLWFVAAAGQTDDRTAGDPAIIRWMIDYRLLVTLRKNKNQSAF